MAGPLALWAASGLENNWTFLLQIRFSGGIRNKNTNKTSGYTCICAPDFFAALYNGIPVLRRVSLNSSGSTWYRSLSRRDFKNQVGHWLKHINDILLQHFTARDSLQRQKRLSTQLSMDFKWYLQSPLPLFSSTITLSLKMMQYSSWMPPSLADFIYCKYHSQIIMSGKAPECC